MKFINNKPLRIEGILKRSSKAVCGVFEREVVVKAENASKTKALLRKKGYVIVGTSEPNGKTRKIWFIAAGANL